MVSSCNKGRNGEQRRLTCSSFACAGQESTEPWSSPSAQQLNFPSITQTVPELLSPPLSPPVTNHGPQRSVAKNSALKLITSFGDPQAKAKFFGQGDDGKTPIAAGTTPIIESAFPADADPTTAILRGNRSQFNTPASARPGQGFGRQRLPSIGEAPDSSLLTAVTKPAGDPYAAFRPVESHDNAVRHFELTRPNTASPRLVKDSAKQPPPPSPSPAAVAALMEGGRNRNGSRTRIPEGLDLSLSGFKDTLRDDLTSPEPSAHSSVRYHWPSRRRGPGSVASSVTSAASSVARSHRGHHQQQHHGKSLDDYIHSLDTAQSKRQGRGTSRDGRQQGRERSQSRMRGGDRDKSRDRGRAAARSYTPKGGKRSPKSPVPMSPEDLINLATPKEGVDQPHHLESRRLIDVSNDEMEPSSQPSTVRKVGYANRDGSQIRVSSRNQSRSGRGSSRARSVDRRVPATLDLRGRSSSRGPPSKRSPTSPQPMSASLQPHVYGSDDEEDYRQALEAKEKFRQRNNRSASKGLREGPPSPLSVRSGWSSRDTTQEKSDSIRRTSSHAGNGGGSSRRKIGAPLPTPAPMQLVTDSSGDLRVMKDERLQKKEAAARELEERRKSLARRPSAPPIMHPAEITPGLAPQTPPDLMALPSTTYVPPRKEDLPSRSASADPNAGRSMYANRNGPPIGLPATPRAMRLVMDSETSRRNNPIPPIPATFAQASPALTTQTQRRSPTRQEEKEVEDEKLNDVPMLLPSTVYTPPPPANSRIAAQIGRSMSAPPVDMVQPEGFSRGPSAMGMQGRRPSHDTNAFPVRRPSHDNNIPPPPPPPVPPMLKELQHLAQPPPPPPAPLPYLGATSPKPVVYGGSSGMIEIVMDDEQPQQQQHQPQHHQPQQQHQQPPPPPPPPVIPVSESIVPIISPPLPPSSRTGHNRGRSSVDNSIGARISRATERMRSASRSRAGARTRSPEGQRPAISAPYESVPMPMPMPSMGGNMGPPVSMNNSGNNNGGGYRVQTQVFDRVQAQIAQQQAQNEYRTGLHQSEMI